MDEQAGLLAEDVMFKWLLTLFLVVAVIGICQPVLARRLRLGQLPGDLAFRFRGRPYLFPFATTLLLSALAWLLMRFL